MFGSSEETTRSEFFFLKVSLIEIMVDSNRVDHIETAFNKVTEKDSPLESTETSDKLARYQLIRGESATDLVKQTGK